MNPQILWIKLQQLGGGFRFAIHSLPRRTCYPQVISERCESVVGQLLEKSMDYPQNYPQPVYKCLLMGENYTSHQHIWKDWKSSQAYINKGFRGRQEQEKAITGLDIVIPGIE